MKIKRLHLAIITLFIMISGLLPIAQGELIVRQEIPDITMSEDETALGVINLYSHFSNDKEWLQFSFLSADNKIEVVIHDDGWVDFSAPKDWYGTDEVTFIASDGQQQASDTIFVKVEPVNDPVLLLSPLLDIYFEEDGDLKGAFNLNTYFQDIDSILDFSYSSDSIIVQIDDEGYVDFYAPNDWYGTERVEFSASDGEYVVTEEVLVTVTSLNDAPRCKVNIASIGLNADQRSKVMELKNYFIDVDEEPLSYIIEGNRRINAELNAEQEQLILKAPEDWSGEEILTLTAKDSSGEASSVQIVVIATRGSDSSGQVFYLLGLGLAIVIAGVRLQLAGRRRSLKSPIKLSSYSHYKGP